jgi:hypothetical protein
VHQRACQVPAGSLNDDTLGIIRLASRAPGVSMRGMHTIHGTAHP